ncbi:MAG: hypothetical protein KBE22_00140 [Candidatus Accumulibacter sp.]|nr:hypothetical protein [Accumulibacter sp.]
MTDDQQEAFDERAAILEFDAGMSLEEAERAAMLELETVEFEQGTASRQRVLTAE